MEAEIGAIQSRTRTRFHSIGKRRICHSGIFFGNDRHEISSPDRDEGDVPMNGIPLRARNNAGHIGAIPLLPIHREGKISPVRAAFGELRPVDHDGGDIAGLKRVPIVQPSDRESGQGQIP